MASTDGGLRPGAGRRLLPLLGAVSIAVVAVALAASLPASRRAPQPGSSATPATSASADVGTPSPTAGSSPSSTASITAGPTETPLPTFEFVRWTTTEATLYSEPGSDIAVAGTEDEPIATVLDRRMLDGVEWIRVQVGRLYAQDHAINGWVPKEADIEVRGEVVHVDPVYEPATIDCPDSEPTVSDLDGLLPAQALACFGSRTLRFSPVWVREEGSEDAAIASGEPEWLAVGSALVVYDVVDGVQLTGSIRIHIDPASGIEVTPGRWVEIEGRFDHADSDSCTRRSDIVEFAIATDEEARLWCRERFVVTAARLLPTAEQPTPPPMVTPGPPATESISFDARPLGAPFKGRRQASGVWTGQELIIWGGWEFDGIPDGPRRQDGGYAYDPIRERWRPIADGPLPSLSDAPTIWTGREMLIWSGRPGNGREPDGAAYDPVADRWRPIPPSPFRSSPDRDGVWTGTEWILASIDRYDRLELAAYDPSADTWRSLPVPPGPYDYGAGLLWTGTQLILRTNTAFSMGDADSAWTPIPEFDLEPSIVSPLVWTGELVVGSTYGGNLSTEVGGFEPWTYLTAWDPATGRKVELPKPPGDVETRIFWAADHVIPLGSPYAFHSASGIWRNVSVPQGLDREEAIIVWAGDRFLIWGGAEGSHSAAIDEGLELIPEWP